VVPSRYPSALLSRETPAHGVHAFPPARGGVFHRVPGRRCALSSMRRSPSTTGCRCRSSARVEVVTEAPVRCFCDHSLLSNGRFRVNVIAPGARGAGRSWPTAARGDRAGRHLRADPALSPAPQFVHSERARDAPALIDPRRSPRLRRRQNSSILAATRWALLRQIAHMRGRAGIDDLAARGHGRNRRPVTVTPQTLPSRPGSCPRASRALRDSGIRLPTGYPARRPRGLRARRVVLGARNQRSTSRPERPRSRAGAARSCPSAWGAVRRACSVQRRPRPALPARSASRFMIA
jgi:hypothetical protein